LVEVDMKINPIAGWVTRGLVIVALLCSIARAQEPQPPAETPPDEVLPKYEDMEVPSVKQLLSEPAVDWIRLKVTDEVLVCEPVFPRPNTLQKIEKQIEELMKNRPNTQAELEAWRDKRAKLNYLNVVLPNGGEVPEGRIETKKIEEVIHHEELLLRRVDLLVKAGEQRQAFELLYQLERRLPEWPGIEDRKNYLLFMEAEAHRQKKHPEEAFAYYEQLNERKPDYPELKSRMGEVTDSLVAAAVGAKDFRRARHFLGRLRRAERTHAIVRKWETDLEQQASKLNAQAKAASAASKYDEAALFAGEAISIWPETPGLRSDFSTAWRRFQRLHVGVMQLPGEPTEFFLPTAADEREADLTRTNLFTVNRYHGTPRYGSRYFEQWEPKDLGRRAVFQLSPGRASWEARPETTATDIVNTFNQLLDPAHAMYDERLSSYLDSIAVTSPLHLEVKFSRVPLRTEALLNFPIRRTEFDAKQYDGPEEMADVFSERFRPVERTPEVVRYRRGIPEADESTAFHVAEVQEHKYEKQEDAIRDLLRGQIDMIANARIWHVDQLIRSNQFFVLKQAVPRVHALQFNPKSEPLRIREFRRAWCIPSTKSGFCTRTFCKPRTPGTPG
jgi:tetratricopeptide (TPR) repeat protein